MLAKTIDNSLLRNRLNEVRGIQVLLLLRILVCGQASGWHLLVRCCICAHAMHLLEAIGLHTPKACKRQPCTCAIALRTASAEKVSSAQAGPA